MCLLTINGTPQSYRSGTLVRERRSPLLPSTEVICNIRVRGLSMCTGAHPRVRVHTPTDVVHSRPPHPHPCPISSPAKFHTCAMVDIRDGYPCTPTTHGSPFHGCESPPMGVGLHPQIPSGPAKNQSWNPHWGVYTQSWLM